MLGARKGRGVLIAIEGIDGVGKRTQLELLHKSLSREGVPHHLISFPRHDISGAFFGELIGRYLRGELGDVEKISPYLSALAFAADRFEARREILDELEAGTLVVADRYVGSNIAYQGARLQSSERSSFLDWIERLEYEFLRVPRSTISIFFHMPVEYSARLMERRRGLQRQNRPLDSYERDSQYLQAVSEEFQRLAQSQPGWVQIDVVDSSGSLRDPEDVHRELLFHVADSLGRDDPDPHSASASLFDSESVVLTVDQRTVLREFIDHRFVPAGRDANRIKRKLLSEAVPVARREAELDLSKKQLVACSILKKGDKYALFKRSWNANRDAMQLKWSLFVGGHVLASDSSSRQDALENAISRELEEELNLRVEREPFFVGFVNDDRNTVARTHLGAIYCLEVDDTPLSMKPAGAREYEEEQSFLFLRADELGQFRGRLDPWSEIVIQDVLGSGRLTKLGGAASHASHDRRH